MVREVLLSRAVLMACPLVAASLALAQATTETAPASAPAAVEIGPVPRTQTAPALVSDTPPREPSTLPATAPETKPETRPVASTEPASQPATAPAVTNGQRKVKMSFKNETIDSVLDWMATNYAVKILRDGKFEGRISPSLPTPVALEEAVAELNKEMRPLGFVALRTDVGLRVATREKAKKSYIPVQFGADPTRIKVSDDLITQVIPLGGVDAVRLKQDLTPMFSTEADVTANAASNTLIITDSSAAIKRIVEIIAAMDKHTATASSIVTRQLKYASASAAAKLINDVFKADDAPGAAGAGGGSRRVNVGAGGIGGAGGFGGGGFGGRGGLGGAGGFGGIPGLTIGGGAGAGAETSRRAGRVVAASDDRTNTLVVTGPPDTLLVVEGVIDKLDSNPSEDQVVRVYRLRNTQAGRIQGTLNTLFGTGTATSTGGFGQSRTTGTTGSTGSYQRTTGGTPFGSAGNNVRNQRNTAPTYYFGGGGGGGQISQSARAAAGDLAGQVFVVADEDSNSLLIATSAKLYDRVTAILDDLDRPVPQVLIKVLLAEVTHTNGSDIGLEFSYVNTRLNGMGTKVGTDFGLAQSSGGFAVSMIEGDFQVALKALATANKLDVLSRPYILASDNQLASIIIGQQVPFITNTRITDTGQTVNTVQYQDIGIILNVTPHINPDGKVIMDVAPEISSLTDSSVTISQGVNAQIFNRRAAQSRIAIDNGRTVVIGGLMEDRKSFREDKVPILGDIPWLGDLFKHRIDSKTKTELLIFLTPHVAMDSNVLHPMSKDEVQGLKIVPNAVQPGTFQEHLEGMRRQSTTTQPVEPLNVPPTDFSREPAKLPGK